MLRSPGEQAEPGEKQKRSGCWHLFAGYSASPDMHWALDGGSSLVPRSYLQLLLGLVGILLEHLAAQLELCPPLRNLPVLGAEGLLPSGDEFSPSFLKKNFIYLFWLCWVFFASWLFSSCGESGLLSSCSVWASHCAGFSCCGAGALGYADFSTQQLQLPGSRAQAQELWCMGLVAAWHVGSSRIRDQTMSPVLAGGFFTTEPLGKPHPFLSLHFSALAFHFTRNDN